MGVSLQRVEPVTRFKEPPSLKRLSPRIAADFREGLRAANAACPRAATVMLRRGIEQACLEAGADKKDRLVEMIAKLEAKKIISPVMARTAHTVRAIANKYGAHADDDGLDEVDDEELELLVRLAVGVADGMTKAC